MHDLYRELISNGWSINDIEETDFDLLMALVTDSKKKQIEVVPLEDFIKRI